MITTGAGASPKGLLALHEGDDEDEEQIESQPLGPQKREKSQYAVQMDKNRLQEEDEEAFEEFENGDEDGDSVS